MKAALLVKGEREQVLLTVIDYMMKARP